MASDIALCKLYLKSENPDFDYAHTQILPATTISHIIDILAQTAPSKLPEYVWTVAEYLGMGWQILQIPSVLI